METGKAAVPPVPLANIQRVFVPLAQRFGFCPSPRKISTKPKEQPQEEPDKEETAEEAPAVEPKAKPKIQILEDTTDPSYEPTAAEIEEYAVWLGMDLDSDKHLFWIARSGLKAPCKDPWKPCKTEDGDMFYFNFSTGESIWDHPADIYYKTMYQKQKAQSSTGSSVVPSLKLPQQVEQVVSDMFRSPRKLTARVSARTKAAEVTEAEEKTAKEKHGKIQILEYEPNYEPTEEEVLEYAVWLGMNLEDDKDLIWIAWAGLKEACPAPWKPCQTEAGDIFFFNFTTGESIWDHPRDQHFRDLLTEHKAKKSGDPVPAC